MDLWAEIGTVSIAAISVIGTGIWRLGLLQRNLLAKMQEFKDEIEKGFEEEKRRITAEIVAVRQKITDVELWGRDNFVKKDTFSEVMDQMRRSIESMGNKLDSRLEKLDGKIDKALNR